MAKRSPPTESQQRAWVEQWRNAGPALERIRIEELAQVDSAAVALQLEDACRAAIAATPPSPTSGLVEQQRIFQRRRNA